MKEVKKLTFGAETIDIDRVTAKSIYRFLKSNKYSTNYNSFQNDSLKSG